MEVLRGTYAMPGMEPRWAEEETHRESYYLTHHTNLHISLDIRITVSNQIIQLQFKNIATIK